MICLNNTDAIIARANAIVRDVGTRDPERIARELDIAIMEVPFEKQKGVYKVIKRNRFIFIKSDLHPVMRNIVLWHEIGHDQLHRKQASVFQEFSLFDMNNNVMEFEANTFAAQIGLPEDEILELIYNGCDASQIARAMKSDINLVALKVSELSRRGGPVKIYAQNCLQAPAE